MTIIDRLCIIVALLTTLVLLGRHASPTLMIVWFVLDWVAMGIMLLLIAYQAMAIGKDAR